MKKQTVIAIVLFFLFSTINPSQKIIISKFNIKKIQIENNFLLRENEIKELLVNIYDENLLFLSNSKIEKFNLHYDNQINNLKNKILNIILEELKNYSDENVYELFLFTN